MYRRSNSSSNIPLPKTNLFGTDNSRPSRIARRSQSTSRLSQRDSVTSQLRSQRKSSLDRKTSAVGLLRATPLQRPGARSGSLQRTTPTSAISQRTNSSRGATPSSNRKDHVTIQKLSTDKKWVSEQYIKVQNFIMSSNLFDIGIVNSTNIKPPSINNFIYITRVLLMEIFPRVKIDKDNYKEVIPTQLKVLRYPGTLTNSVLKTVNTVHSWPQVIGMWSWLIDKVNFSSVQDSEDFSFIDQLEPEDRTKFLLRQHAADFILRRYKIFNINNPTEEVEKTNEAYIRNLADALDVDIEKFKQLQDDVARKKEYRNKQIQDIEHLKAENTKMKSEIEEMKKEIEEFEESDPIEEGEIENVLQLLQSNFAEQRETLESTKRNISELQEAINVQPCTFQKKLALLRQIEELKRDIQVKRGKIEHAREIKNKFDHELTTEISKIQSLVIQWNRALMEVSIKKPYLKKLLLREKGFHDPHFLKELQEVLDYKGTVENDIADALTKIDNDLRTKDQGKCRLEQEQQKVIESICRTNEDNMAVEERIAEDTREINNLTKDLDSKKLAHAQKILELQEEGSSHAQMNSISKLKTKKEGLEVEVKKFGPKMLSFFVEMHNQVVTNLGEMEGVKAKLAENIERKQMGILEKQEDIMKILNIAKP